MFNQTAGLGSGFGHDEDYNLYDKPLFTDRTAASIYKNVKNVEVNEDSNVKNALEGGKSARAKPVEFEKKKLEMASDNIKGGLEKK